jgi:1,4-alpha-glucan branching enzyme
MLEMTGDGMRALNDSPTNEEIENLVCLNHDRPSSILGPHRLPGTSGIVIRAYAPGAVKAWVRPLRKNARRREMEGRLPGGFFEAVFPNCKKIFRYHLVFSYPDGRTEETEDAYAFPFTDLGDLDLHLLAEGTHLKSYEKLGAQLRTCGHVEGMQFCVWAPNAKSVSVVGDFNAWCDVRHMMNRVRSTGYWSLFVPGVKKGQIYKYAVRSWADHQTHWKTDPYAFAAEVRPKSGVQTWFSDGYRWGDREWMRSRQNTDWLRKPVSIYEVHLGSWKRDAARDGGFLNYRELAHQLVEYVKGMGYTHLELLPVMEHPLDQSWGYQTINYFAPTSRFGTPDDFMYFVDYCHQNEIGVILDWVPSHFARDSHGLAHFDGRQIYAYENWKKGEHKEWGTLVFDFGRNEVRNFLISNALFWLDRYHIDGLRVDAVASMIYLDYSRKPGEWEPNIYGGRENLEAIDFLKRFNEIVHERHHGVMTIAEESTSWPKVSKPTYEGGLGFSLKWNMGWMHDVLDYFSKDPIYRRHHLGTLTFALLYAFTENFILPISHDEVVHGKRALLEKMPGDDWQKFANVRLFFGFMCGHPGKKLHFMGNDFGMRWEWDSQNSINWHLIREDWHMKLNRFVRDLNVLYRQHPALYEVDFDCGGFEWIDFSDVESSVVSFVRWSRDYRQMLLFTFNMTPVPRYHYRVGAPLRGYYKEILNSDAVEYGGSGIGNFGGAHSEDIPWQWRSYSLCLNLPPLGVNIFRFGPG